MEFDRYIVSSQIVIGFELNSNIESRLADLEDKLAGYFQVPFSKFAFPKEIDPALPRIQAFLENKHSVLQVSLAGLSLTTQYDKA